MAKVQEFINKYGEQIKAEHKDVWRSLTANVRLAKSQGRAEPTTNYPLTKQGYNDYMEAMEKAIAEKKQTSITKNDVLKLVRDMMKGAKKQRALVTPKELLPMIQKLKEQLEAEKKIGSLEKVIEKKGISNADLLQYVLSQMSQAERDEVIASL